MARYRNLQEASRWEPRPSQAFANQEAIPQHDSLRISRFCRYNSACTIQAVEAMSRATRGCPTLWCVRCAE